MKFWSSPFCGFTICVRVPRTLVDRWKLVPGGLLQVKLSCYQCSLLISMFCKKFFIKYLKHWVIIWTYKSFYTTVVIKKECQFDWLTVSDISNPKFFASIAANWRGSTTCWEFLRETSVSSSKWDWASSIIKQFRDLMSYFPIKQSVSCWCRQVPFDILNSDKIITMPWMSNFKFIFILTGVQLRGVCSIIYT